MLLILIIALALVVGFAVTRAFIARNRSRQQRIGSHDASVPGERLESPARKQSKVSPPKHVPDREPGLSGAAERPATQPPASLPSDAYVGAEPFVFASYAHSDVMLVFPELKLLQDLGFRIWYDEGIPSGGEWPEHIARALHNATSFLVFISHSAVQSRNVRNEINFALNHSKPFLAVYIEDTPLPPGLELRMGDIQALMKWKMPEDYYQKKLVSAFPASVREASNT